MTKRLIATALAASIAFTSILAAPARADTGEIGRLLLGAGALFIIGSAISNQNRNRVVTTRRAIEPPHSERHVHPRRNVVPSVCLQVNRYDYGPRRFFSQSCLQNNMRYVDLLPSSCLRTFWGNHGRRTVYSATCLRRNGFIFG